MKASLNTIRFLNQHYGCAGDPAPEGTAKLAAKIGAQLGAIEETIDVGSKYQGALIVKVVSCVDHPNATRLHLCRVDDGGVAQGVERDQEGYVQVVCGAPNVRADMLAVWLPPGTIVPSTYNDADPFVLEARDLRGQKSNGMLASPKELAISDSHEGILEVVLDGDEQVAPGTSFAAAYHLEGDVVFDIENKMFTHRPDCFGLLGVARELAGIQGQPFRSPVWYRVSPSFPEAEAEPLPLELHNELPGLVPRFCMITLRDIQLSSSPLWLQIELAKVGLRPINNIVDYTNWFMLETGQPLHAYDYDKVKALSNVDGATIVVRNPKPGEKLALLNGKTIEPRIEAIMIATDKQLIGVGGVMGGADTEVDENTRNIILECGTFDMYSIRRTSMAHGLFTDAVTRFNKGQSPLQNLAVLAKIVDEIQKFAGGKVASQVIDDNHLDQTVMERQSLYPPVTVSAGFIIDRLGFQLSANDMKTLLENVEFTVASNDDELTITAPFWRTDIELREDVVEEVGRLYGFDRLPMLLPTRDLTPAPKDVLLELKAAVRQSLSRAGANEVLTYSFVHGDLLERVGQDKAHAFRIGNALSPDLQYYRLSLTPSLLEKLHPNIKAGHERFALFEVGKAHSKSEQDEAGLPDEQERVALVYAASDKASRRASGAAFYQARKQAEHLLQSLGIHHFSWQPCQAQPGVSTLASWGAPFIESRSAFLTGDLQGRQNALIGVVGEYKPSVTKSLKLPKYCAGFELSITMLQALREEQTANDYVALPRFPKLEQDICLKVAAELPYQQLLACVRQKSDELQPAHSLLTLEPLDIYQRDDDQAHRQITFRLSVASYERTLTDAEISKLLDQLATAVKQALGAERV